MTTHTVLLDKNGNVPVPPASMSKLMTLNMLFESLRDGRVAMDTTFPVSAAAVEQAEENLRIAREQYGAGLATQTSLLQAETQNQADTLVRSAAQAGMTDDEITNQREALLDTAAVQARTNIKTNFILQEIAEKENIVVNDQEMIQHIMAIAQRRKEDPSKLIKDLQRNGQIPGIRNSLLINKALDFLLEHASVTETVESTTPDA